MPTRFAHLCGTVLGGHRTVHYNDPTEPSRGQAFDRERGRDVKGSIRQSGLFVACCLLVAPGTTLAQSGFATIELSFSNPGARSLGLGGAFVALADDATAAFANPSGLVQLTEPEVSIEGRYWSYSTPYTLSGRISGTPTGFGIDTNPGLKTGRSEATANGLSFLSVVYPKDRWSLAFYRHQISKFEFSSETQGLFAIPNFGQPGTRREFDRQITVGYDMVSHALAGSWRLSDRLALGLGVVYFESEIQGAEAVFAFDSLDRFFLSNSYLPERNYENISYDLQDSDWGLTAGFLWRLSEQWSVGGVYREGADASDWAIAISSGPLDPEHPPGTLKGIVVTPVSFPDVIGLGVAFRSGNDRVTVGMEWDRVEYSDILSSLSLETNVRLDDADELRAGVEYAFLEARPMIALRAGVWLDPDHRMRSTGADDLTDALFRPGEDEFHLSFGLGMVLGALQLDLGIDFSELVDTASVSIIYGF